jgi:hypothetical protein
MKSSKQVIQRLYCSFQFTVNYISTTVIALEHSTPAPPKSVCRRELAIVSQIQASRLCRILQCYIYVLSTVRIDDWENVALTKFWYTQSRSCHARFIAYRKHKNSNIVQLKHNNIFNNVKLLHVSVTSDHHQADISVHGHDMLSATNMGSHIVYTCYVEFQTLWL